MKRGIKEQIDYGDYPERMGQSTERKLGDPERNVYGDNPAMGRGTPDVERLGSNRFKRVVDKLREVTGIRDLSSQRVQRLIYQDAMAGFMAVKQIENEHTEELQNLAIKAGLKATESEEGRYEIEAILTGAPGDIDVDNFQFQPKSMEDEPEGEPNPEENPEFNIDQLTPQEEFQLEKHKRNVINGIIQGAAKKGHYIFQDPEIKAELDAIDPSLYQHYLKIMSINDFFYFTMEEMIDAASQTGQGVEGKEEVESDEEKNVKIRAQGLLFPILCHEVIKGIEEAVAMHGLPADQDLSDKVRGQTDTLPNEGITLKIGPELLENIRQHLPNEMFEEEFFGIKPFFYVILYRTPAKEFLKIIKNVISQDERDNRNAQVQFRRIFEEASDMRDRYNENKSPHTDDDGGDLDFLRGLGIGPAGQN